MPQFEFSSQRIRKPPTRKTQAPANVIQLPTTTLRCLSSCDKWARDAGGFSGTLKRRSFAVSQNQLTAPTKQTITGNLTTMWGNGNTEYLLGNLDGIPLTFGHEASIAQVAPSIYPMKFQTEALTLNKTVIISGDARYAKRSACRSRKPALSEAEADPLAVFLHRPPGRIFQSYARVSNTTYPSRTSPLPPAPAPYSAPDSGSPAPHSRYADTSTPRSSYISRPAHASPAPPLT